jgi:hypothetical protein
MTQPQADLDFYTLLGYAISRWTMVERSLFRIFLSALDGADPGAAAAAFYALTGFKPKLDVASAALKARFTRYPLHSYHGHAIQAHPLLDVWFGVKGRKDRKKSSLIIKIRTAAGERNKLAHHDVVDQSTNGVRELVLDKSLMDPLNMRTAFPNEADVYNAKKLAAITASFEELYSEMEAFVTLVNETLGQQRISLLQPNCARDPRPVIDRATDTSSIIQL